MKIKISLAFACLLLLNSWVYSQSIEEKFQSLIDSVYAANPTSVGILVHVESSERGISWSGASGYSQKDNQADLSPEQPVWIASNTKTHVSATILRLVEKEKISINDPIGYLISDKSRKLFEGGGYDLDKIKIKHLLSHTSGIQNYANDEYVDFIDQNKKHRWMRDEQLELTVKTGPPLGIPGFTFRYSDANYLLCTEIIETIVNKPFYSAMRELLLYEELGLNSTWFPTLEEKPMGTAKAAHQYWGEMNWDSYNLDISLDLYGGGGIACPAKDLAAFSDNLFNAKIIEDAVVLKLIFTEIETEDEKPANYYLGISLDEYNGIKAYGHGGFWGTVVMFFPELNTSVSVYILERDKRGLRDVVMNGVVEILNEQE